MIEKAHKIIRDTIRKTLGSYVDPEQIDRALNRGLTDYISEILNQGVNAKPISLTRYVKSVPVTNQIPDDFFKEITVLSVADDTRYEGEILTEQEFYDRKNSKLVGPETEHPIARMYSDTEGQKIEVLPEGGNYLLSYYREPIECKFAYTTPDNRTIVYDPDNSVDLDCNVLALSDVISRALLYLGVSLEAQNLILEEKAKQ
jgi:hypothetical protein